MIKNKKSKFITFFTSLMFMVASCTNTVNSPPTVSSNKDVLNKLTQKDNFKITNLNSKNDIIHVKFKNKDVELPVSTSTNSMKVSKPENSSFSVKGVTSVSTVNTSIGTNVGTQDLVYNIVTQNDTDTFNFTLSGPSGSPCGTISGTLSGFVGSGTLTVTIPPLSIPNGSYTVNIAGFTSTATINNQQSLTLTQERSGSSVIINLTTTSGDFWDFSLVGPMESLPYTQIAASCARSNAVITWNDVNTLIPGTYNANTFLKAYPGVSANASITIERPEPSPTPTPDINEEDNENLSQDDLKRLQDALFPECNNFSTQSIDLGKGPKCGGKLGNLGYIYDLIDLAGQIIEARAEENLNAASKESLDAVTKSQIAKLQRIVKQIHEGLKEVNAVRSEFRIGNGKNIGTLKGSLGGKDIDLIGVSGKGDGVSNNSNIRGSNTRDKLVNIDNVDKNDRILNTQNNKDFDSEAKLLEKVAQDLEKNPNLTGQLKLFSERRPCKESCNDLIKEFQSKYGDRVKLNVLYGPRR